MTNQESITLNQEILDRLKMIPVLKSFDDEELEELLRLGEIREYAPGTILLEEGKTDGWIFYLVSGKVAIRNNRHAAFDSRNFPTFAASIGSPCFMQHVPQLLTSPDAFFVKRLEF